MEKKYAIKLPAGAKPEIIEFRKEEEGLDFYYKAINCGTIDIVKTVVDGYDLVVDDEGLFKDAPVMNVPASLLYGYLDHGQPIVGDALLCKREFTPEGVDTVGYSLEEAYELLALFGIDVTAED